MAKVITFGNFKGGVGKTTASCMLSYSLHKKGYKVALIDFDPQANSTGFLTTSYGISLSDFVSVYQAMEQDNIENSIINLDDGFDLIPSANDLVDFNNLAIKKTAGNDPKMEHFFLYVLLNDIQDNYDFIIIDVPPTISEFTNNALVASDYTLIVMQTEPDSLIGAINFHEYVKGINDMIGTISDDLNKVNVLGVLPYLEKKRSKIDESTLKQSMDDDVVIKDLILKTHVYKSERVKRFRVEGITDKDHHDRRVHKMYNEVLDEILKKVGNDNE